MYLCGSCGSEDKRLKNCKKRLWVSSYLFFRPSVRPHGKLDSHWTDFEEDLYLKFFRSCVEELHDSLRSDKNSGYITKDVCMFTKISRWLLPRMRNVSVAFCRKPSQLWFNMGTHGTPRQATDDNIIRRMRFACYITKATDTVIIYNIYCFSMATMVRRTRLNVTFIRTVPVCSPYTELTLVSVTDTVCCVYWAVRAKNVNIIQVNLSL